MIRTLRIKLVIASMLSLFLVLAVILGGVNLLNYRNICRSADQILVLDGGKIVQQGRHEELIRQSGIYADFVGGKRESAGWKL